MDRTYEYQDCIIEQAIEIGKLQKEIKALALENCRLCEKIEEIIAKYEGKKEAIKNDDLRGLLGNE